ncbi:DNA polymerase III subunit beta [bacterium]|nr:DNA polymerase III subunit beta [bacterium]MBU1598603.1 DNA polymerase III subunit beta [bacterium]
MKIICNKEVLINQIQRVQIANIKSTLPILNNLLLEASDGYLTTLGTDMDISIKYKQKMNIDRDGAVILPIKKLISIINSLSNEIEIDVDENIKASISSEKFSSHLLGLRKDEYPIFPEVSWKVSFNLPLESLLDMLKKTVFSASSDETFIPYCGILMILEEKKMILVSSDGHRLSYIKKDIDVDKNIKVIIPIKTVQEVIRVFKGVNGEIKISLTDKEICFEQENLLLISRQLDGDFPDYNNVIPKEGLIELNLNRDNFSSVIKRVSLMSDEKRNSIKFNLKKNLLLISTFTQEIGDAKEDIEVDYSGKDIEIAFNPKYIIDVLRILTSEKIIFSITEQANKGMIRQEGEDFLHILMPMRI